MREKQVIRLIVEGYQDRESLFAVLARNGYKVWEEQKPGEYAWSNKTNFVCFEVKP